MVATSFPGLAVLATNSIEQTVHSTHCTNERRVPSWVYAAQTSLHFCHLLQQARHCATRGGGRRPAEPKQARKASSTLQLLTNCATACPTGLPQITKRSARCVTSTASGARGAVYSKRIHGFSYSQLAPKAEGEQRQLARPDTVSHTTWPPRVLPAAVFPLGARTDHAHQASEKGRRERKTGARKRSRSSGRRREAREEGALLLGSVIAVDDQERSTTAPAGRRSGRRVIRCGSGGGGGSQAAARQSLNVVQAQAGGTLGKVLFVFF